MSVDYVIPGISWKDLVIKLDQLKDIVIEDQDNCLRLSTPLSPDGSKQALQKRVVIAKVVGMPGDEVPEAASESVVFLYKTDDLNNSWFGAFSVVISQPEFILEKISDAFGLVWYSEYDEQYNIIVGEDEDEYGPEDIAEAMDETL